MPSVNFNDNMINVDFSTNLAKQNMIPFNSLIDNYDLKNNNLLTMTNGPTMPYFNNQILANNNKLINNNIDNIYKDSGNVSTNISSWITTISQNHGFNDLNSNYFINNNDRFV